jgi:site-specific DNA-methyltransferase (adenine-specific)
VLYRGDCFSILPKLDLQADAIITDPPFAGTDCDWDVKIPLDKFWEMVVSKTKQAANFVLFGCGGFTADLINSMRKWYRYDQIWVKSKKCGFLNANKMPLRNHESVLLFGRPGFKDAATYNPQKSLGGKPGIKTRNHKSSVYRDVGQFTHISDGSVHPSSVLCFKSEKGLHPTQKPVDLMEYLVRSYSNEGDTVIDPFAGSGTTAVACINTGRRFIGIEQDKHYFDIAVERIRKAYNVRNSSE